MRNRFLLGCLLMFSVLFGFSQDPFYHPLQVQLIEIQFSQSNWDYMLDTSVAGADGYVMAEFVKINGEYFDSVGVKYKGNSSYNVNQVKNPFHIELDYIIEDQMYQGFSDIKLSNGFKDPSFCREVVSYNILQKYMHVSQAGFAWVLVNGNVIGLFSNAEHVGKKFVNKHFYSSDNTFFKCNPPGGAGPGGGSGTPSLVYLGNDSSAYQTSYELKSDYGWGELVAFCDSLSNQSATIANHLDVDRVLWMLAFNNVFVNLDSYTGGFSQNYYLYKDENNRFNPVVWDLNESFGCFNNSGTGNLTLTQMQQMSPLLHETTSNKPLIQKLFANPEYKRRYMAHFRTLVQENFSNGLYLEMAESYQEIIDSLVSADPNKLFTYSQFGQSLAQQVSSPNGLIPGLQQLMAARLTWLQSQSIYTAVPPALDSVAHLPEHPMLGGEAVVKAFAPGAGMVRLGFRDAHWKKFSYLQMLDDGNHGDGLAGDGWFGAFMPVSGAAMEYYVYAENTAAGVFSPARAEHEWYPLVADTQTPLPGEIVINEFLALNQSDTTDANGQFEDWIELRNRTNGPLSLDGLFLSDDGTQLMKWPLPLGTTIGANGHLLIWADEDEWVGELHTNFKLSGGGEAIYLSDASGLVHDSILFGEQLADISLARCPDGTGTWQLTPLTTPGYANQCVIESIARVSEPGFLLYPNPASWQVVLKADDGLPLEGYWLADVTGRRRLSGFSANTEAMIMVNGLPDGLYMLFFRNGQGMRKMVIRR